MATKKHLLRASIYIDYVVNKYDKKKMTDMIKQITKAVKGVNRKLKVKCVSEFEGMIDPKHIKLDTLPSPVDEKYYIEYPVGTNY